MACQLNLSVPDELRDQLQAYADARGITIAAAVRVILHDGLNPAPAPSAGPHPAGELRER